MIQLTSLSMASKQNKWRDNRGRFNFCFVLLVSSVYVDFVSSIIYPCPLKTFEEQSADLIGDLCLNEYYGSDCKPFLKHFNWLDLPAGFSLTDDDFPVKRPASLDLTPFLTKYHSYKAYFGPSVYINWSSSLDNSSRENSKGYLLVWENSAEVSCTLLQFDTNRTDLLSKKLRFQYNLTFLSPRENYVVKVYSMPPPKNLEESQKKSTFLSLTMTSGSAIVDDSDPANWVPSVSPRIRMESTIEVKISHSPSSFNLTQFTVILLKRNFDDRNQFKTVYYTEPPDSQDSYGLVSFTNLEEGVYRIEIHVTDPYQLQDGKCMCWIRWEGSRRCELCDDIATDWIKVSRSLVYEPKEMDEQQRNSSPSEFITCIIVITLLTLQNKMLQFWQ
ncbi:hypothetical protein RRG08_027363 [Elysia crispata]|uniref:Death domain-containing protein n=1 Tax=Elysia crispata TaxID=231223 RepID=A0AAE0YL63_9GAST|nr:hypothetical protein RRG08_027363 [Elysia crispata]